MSAQSTTTAQPSAGQGGSDAAPGESDQPIEDAATSTQALPLGTEHLANLLANGQWTDGAQDSSPGIADGHVYDGHVALALDTGVLPDIDSTLDLLTSSHHLFDVPALDVSTGSDDASST